jgi:putative nucleotidyltransferase with HDIG domain
MKDNKMFLSIDLIKPGMSTAEVVFNKLGNVMIWENIVLDESLILRLRNNGIEGLIVYDDKAHLKELSPSNNSAQHFLVAYEQDANTTKQIFNDISSGRRLDIEAANNIVNSVVAKNDENRHIIDSIMRVRSIDEYTYYHSLNVSMLCMLIGRWLRLDEVHVQNLAQAGLLHDIGKTLIPLEIINKPGKLSGSEFAEMKRHSEYGYNVVNNMEEVPPEVAVAILTHHEKEDGSGYPIGLKGNQLNLYSKVITIADIFDAMTANRTYKSKDTPFQVFELMQHGSFGVLDPVVLKVFLENISTYYIGTKVKLNTGEQGEVVFMNKMNFSRPVVQVDDRYIDTAVSKFIRIKEFV